MFFILPNLDIFFIISIIVSFIILLLTLWIIMNKGREIHTYFFLSLSFTTFLWIILILFRFYSLDISTILMSARLTFSCGVLIVYFLFYFTLFFPKFKKEYTKYFHILFNLISFIILLITFTPFVVNNISIINNKQIDIYEVGYYITAIYFLVTIGLSLYNSISKIKILNEEEMHQSSSMLIGLILTMLSIFSTNILITILTGQTIVAKFSPLLTIFFIIFSGVGILKYRVFNIKIITTELLIFTLWISTFIRLLLSNSGQDVIINGLFFIITIILGILLIRGTIKESEQKEEMEKLTRKLVKVNAELRQVNKELKELDKMKTEFVSIASHQFRTPLTIIKGYSSMLLENFFGKMIEPVKEAVNIIYDSSERLAIIIDDFLTITKIELGKMEFDITNFDFSELVNNTIKEFKFIAKEKKLEIKQKKMPGDYSFTGDYGKSKQIISNILDNSIKYTKKGGVLIELSRSERQIIINISDTGIGIKSEELPQLFKKFTRIGEKEQIKYTGTGLGLYVVSQLVKAHQGQIYAESAGLNKGSTITIKLPQDLPK